MTQNRERIKKAAKKKNAIQKLKKARYLQTDDTRTVNCNDNVNIDDLITARYNSDAEIENLSHAETVKMAANSVSQQQAKRIIKKYKNLKRKATKKIDQPIKKRKNEKADDVVFVKQVPMHPRDKLARARKKKVMLTSCLLNKYRCIFGTD